MLFVQCWRRNFMAENTEIKIQHIAIIMDGNRRWAEQRGLLALDGHKAGAQTVRKIVEACKDFDIKYLTLYAFSTENWNRPKKEIGGLMFLLKRFINVNIDKINEEGIRLRAIGKIDLLPNSARNVLLKGIEKTKNNYKWNVILALSYGGRAEIIDAVKKISSEAVKGKINPEKIDENTFRNYLYAPDVPDPELLIRTSGEYRVSNFLLWQISYTELWITEKFWPDFDKEDLKEAINSYCKRERRFGKRCV